MKKRLHSILTIATVLLMVAGASAQTQVGVDNAASQKNMRIRGLMTYDNKKDVTNYGVYDYTVTAPIARKQIVSIPRIGASGGSVVKDNVLYYFDYSIMYGYVSSAKYYTYNLATNEQATQKSFSYTADAEEVYSHAAMSVATDPTTGIVYCCCFSYDSDTEEITYKLSTWDLENATKKVIAPLTSPLRVLAASADGQLYGITASTAASGKANNGGVLVRVNKATGELTTVGDTGVRPGAYFQSATIDVASGIMYWFANEEDEAANLYTVNLTDGSVSKLGALPEGDQVVCAYVAANYADGVPSRAENASLTFNGGSLSGTISFNVPTEDYSGAAMTGDVTYVVTAAGQELTKGTAQAGAEVSVPVAVKEDGAYTFLITLSNATGKGPDVDIDKYVGYDTPKAVADVTFTREGNTNKVTWVAPTEGVNGGYIDASALTYSVTRMPDAVASTCATNTFSEEFEPAQLAAYYYTVEAINGTHKSESTTSNTLTAGAALVPPYSEDFSDAKTLDIFTIIDANEDGKTWKRSTTGAMSYQYSTKNDADDWLIMPPLKLEAGKSYAFSMKAYSMNVRYDERLEVKMGKSATADAMTTSVKPATTYAVALRDAKVETVDIVPEETGVYYIGFHAISDKNKGTLYLDDIAVAAGKNMAGPEKPANLVVTAGAKGELSAKISFNASAKNAQGDELTGALTYDVLRGTTKVASSVAVNPGEAVNITDNSVPTAGTYTYSVVCKNADGESKAAEATLYIGEDIPLPPAEAHVTDNFDGTVTINWTASSLTGMNGGYVDSENVQYDISPRSGVSVATNVSGTQFVVKDFDVTGTQALAYYKIVAHNAVGKNPNYVISDTILSGKPYDAPYEEGFTDNAYTTSLWNTTTLVGKSYDSAWSLRNEDGVGIDGSYADLAGYVAGCKSRFETPKINVKDCNEASLSFASRIPTGNMKLSLEVSFDYGKWQPVSDVEATTGWTTNTYKISIPDGANIMRIGFVGECVDKINYIYLDNVKVTTSSATGINSVKTDDGIIVEGNNIAVSNAENAPIEIFTVAGQLVARGIGSLQCGDLAAGIYVVRSGGKASKVIIK